MEKNPLELIKIMVDYLTINKLTYR